MSSEPGLLCLFPARCCFATARRRAFSRVVVIFLDTEQNLSWLFHKGFELDPWRLNQTRPGLIFTCTVALSWPIERAKVPLSEAGWVIHVQRRHHWTNPASVVSLQEEGILLNRDSGLSDGYRNDWHDGLRRLGLGEFFLFHVPAGNS